MILVVRSSFFPNYIRQGSFVKKALLSAVHIRACVKRASTPALYSHVLCIAFQLGNFGLYSLSRQKNKVKVIAISHDIHGKLLKLFLGDYIPLCVCVCESLAGTFSPTLNQFPALSPSPTPNVFFFSIIYRTLSFSDKGKNYVIRFDKST